MIIAQLRLSGRRRIAPCAAVSAASVNPVHPAIRRTTQGPRRAQRSGALKDR